MIYLWNIRRTAACREEEKGMRLRLKATKAKKRKERKSDHD
jgi:hypothetical protein